MVDVHYIPRFTAECGAALRQAPVAFRTWGRLNAAADNAVIVCHALTGDTQADDWWAGLFGPGRVLDPERFFIVCMNVPGSPYGSASPVSIDPETGRPYGAAFPELTVRDCVRMHRAALDALGVRQAAFAIGGSMGGMQVLEWALQPGFVRALIPIAVGAQHSAWCIGFSEAQRQAIYADPRWQDGRYPPEAAPEAGLAAARMIAMISYRSQASFEDRFGRSRMSGNGSGAAFAVESYLRYQGAKLVGRFDANCYVRLTQLMDSHDLAYGRGELVATMQTITQPALVIGIDSDILYPPAEQRALAALLPNATLEVIEAPHGHDAFLIETDQLQAIIQPWLNAKGDLYSPEETAPPSRARS